MLGKMGRKQNDRNEQRSARRFPCRFDRRSRRITLFVSTGTAAGLAAVLYYAGSGGYVPAWGISLLAAVLLLYVLSIPRYLSVGQDAVEFHCVVEMTRIRREDLRSVRRIQSSELPYLFVLLGSYGFFGYFGYYFDLKEWEAIKVYAGDRSKLVLVEDIYEQKYLVSCTDPDAFVAAVMETMLPEPENNLKEKA